VKLWKTTTGKELLSLPGHTAAVNCVAFGPDGRHLATGSDDKTVRIWDTHTGRAVTVFKGHEDEVRGVAFHPKGRLVVSGSKTTIKVWNSLIGQTVDERTLQPPGSIWIGGGVLALSADGKRVVVGHMKTFKPVSTVQIWEFGTWKEVISLKLEGVAVTQVAFSPDDAYVAASSLDQTVRVWDAKSGAEVAVLHTEDAARSVAFSPDGSRLAVGTENRLVMLWAFPGKEARTLHKREGRGTHWGATSVAFSPGGQRLAGVCDGTRGWDVITGKELRSLPGGGRQRIAWSPVDDCIAGVSPAHLTEASTGNLTAALLEWSQPSEWGGSAFSNDGRLVAGTSGQHCVAVWNTATGVRLHTFQTGARGGRDVSCVALSPDGKLLAVGNFNNVNPAKRGSLQVWDLKTGRSCFAREESLLGVWGLAFSPDGKLLAAAMGYNWTGRDKTGQVRVWDTKKWQVVRKLSGHSASAWTVCFSPDSKRLASVGGPYEDRFNPTGSGEVKLWDMTTGQEVWALTENKGAFFGVAFSPDGRRLATAAADGTVKLWDGTPLAETPAYEPLPDAK
jgi:WD40 repeat protein